MITKQKEEVVVDQEVEPVVELEKQQIVDEPVLEPMEPVVDELAMEPEKSK